MKTNQGTLFVVSGPSGTGKGTIMNLYFQNHPDDNSFLSVSATTRKPREGEIDGVNYYFKTEEEFKQLIADDGFAEWAQFCGNYYGTPKQAVLDMLEDGKNVVLEIEVQGAMKVKKAFPDAVGIFVLPPSFEELKQRLISRGTETEEVISERIRRAKEEVLLIDNYDYILINENLDDAVETFRSIIIAEGQKVNKNTNKINEVCERC